MEHSMDYASFLHPWVRLRSDLAPTAAVDAADQASWIASELQSVGPRPELAGVGELGCFWVVDREDPAFASMRERLKPPALAQAINSAKGRLPTNVLDLVADTSWSGRRHKVSVREVNGKKAQGEPILVDNGSLVLARQDQEFRVAGVVGGQQLRPVSITALAQRAEDAFVVLGPETQAAEARALAGSVGRLFYWQVALATVLTTIAVLAGLFVARVPFAFASLAIVPALVLWILALRQWNQRREGWAGVVHGTAVSWLLLSTYGLWTERYPTQAWAFLGLLTLHLILLFKIHSAGAFVKPAWAKTARNLAVLATLVYIPTWDNNDSARMVRFAIFLVGCGITAIMHWISTRSVARDAGASGSERPATRGQTVMRAAGSCIVAVYLLGTVLFYVSGLGGVIDGGLLIVACTVLHVVWLILYRMRFKGQFTRKVVVTIVIACIVWGLLPIRFLIG